jgi:phage terminase large subunit-like protein
MRRVANPVGHRTSAELAKREPTASPVDGLTPGPPPRPQFFGPSKERTYWLHLEEYLSAKRLLAVQDGDAVAEWVAAKLRGDTSAAKAIVKAVWAKRAPFPDTRPEAPLLTMEAFLAKVQDGRDTFAARMSPERTVCLDWDRTGKEFFEYQWAEDDPAAVARRYAQLVDAGTILAGELLIRAARRFITDIERGAERGLFFDPLAARHVVRFAELFCGLKLMPWQVFCLANIFGWKRPSGARRFTEAWISCAKKNGKTALASTVALWGLICDGEQFPDVFAAATKKDQSRLVWRDAKRAVKASEQLSGYVTALTGALVVKGSDGSFTPLASEEKSLDGLRPSFIIADEVSFWGSREMWDTLTKGVVSRVQPLVLAVTTAGRDRTCFAFGKFDLASKILRGIIADDTTFCCVFSLDEKDDWSDENCWPKANPSLGVTIKVEHLRKLRDEAVEAPSGVTSFVQYHCNVWPDVALSRQGSIPRAKWEACSGLDLLGGNLTPMEACVRFLTLNRESPFYLGLDVGLSSDLTALVSLFPYAIFEEGKEPLQKKVALWQIFMPEHDLLNKEKAWRVPLSQWAREGWITLQPGDMTDVRALKKEIIGIFETYYVRDLRFDPWQFQVAAAELTESGKPCVAVAQTAKELTAPCREVITAVHNQEIVHFGNPVLAWMAGNVVLAEDAKHGGTKPEKLSYNEKIDGISALVNAWHGLISNPPSVYEHRGLTFID